MKQIKDKIGDERISGIELAGRSYGGFMVGLSSHSIENPKLR